MWDDHGKGEGTELAQGLKVLTFSAFPNYWPLPTLIITGQFNWLYIKTNKKLRYLYPSVYGPVVSKFPLNLSKPGMHEARPAIIG